MGEVATSNSINPNGVDAVDRRVLGTLDTTVGRAMVLRVTTLFRHAGLKRIAALPAIRASKDYSALRKIAHDFVSDAASVGAFHLSTFARQIEMGAIAHDELVLEASRDLEILMRAADDALSEIVGEAK